MTGYESLAQWVKGVPLELQVIWFDGTGRVAAYNHAVSNYECLPKIWG